MVTVIIPAYNHPEDLQKALYSLAAQTSKDFCVIVSDDCSSDNLQEICNNFQLNLTYIKSEKNRGCGGNRQFALEYFKQHPTEYLMWLDSDDSLFPNAIERLTKIIKYNNAEIIATDIIVDSENIELNVIKAENSKTGLHGKIYKADFLIKKNISFPFLKSNEDLAFNLTCYSNTTEIYNVNESYYLGYNNSHSLTRQGNHEIMQKLVSVEYIEAMYWAYTHRNRLTNEIIASILHIYNNYQEALIFNLLQPKHNKQVNEMLHNPKIMDTIVRLYYHPEIKLEVKQGTINKDTLIFYPQTYGQGISNFITQKEVNEVLKNCKKD